MDSQATNTNLFDDDDTIIIPHGPVLVKKEPSSPKPPSPRPVVVVAPGKAKPRAGPPPLARRGPKVDADRVETCRECERYKAMADYRAKDIEKLRDQIHELERRVDEYRTSEFQLQQDLEMVRKEWEESLNQAQVERFRAEQREAQANYWKNLYRETLACHDPADPQIYDDPFLGVQ